MSDPIRSISQNNYLLSNGGGGHEYSGTNGVYVDNVNEVIGLDTSASNAIETVIENSGAWGGAGLPISAGPGIKVALENGTLVVSNDETVLWEGSIYDTNASASLSESYKNFNILGISYNIQEASNISGYVEVPTAGSVWNVSHAWASFTDATFGTFFSNLTANSDTTLSVNKHMHWYVPNNATTINRGNNGLVIRKIVGINRISGGN